MRAPQVPAVMSCQGLNGKQVTRADSAVSPALPPHRSAGARPPTRHCAPTVRGKAAAPGFDRSNRPASPDTGLLSTEPAAPAEAAGCCHHTACGDAGGTESIDGLEPAFAARSCAAHVCLFRAARAQRRSRRPPHGRRHRAPAGPADEPGADRHARDRPRRRSSAPAAPACRSCCSAWAASRSAPAAGPGRSAGVFLRGSNANHVVLLIDGVRVNSATAGTNALREPAARPDRAHRGAARPGQRPVRRRRDRRRDPGLHAPRRRPAGPRRSGQRAHARRIARLRPATQARRGSRCRPARATSRNGSATNADNLFSFNPDADPYRNAHAAASVSQDWAAGQTLTLRGQLSDGRSALRRRAGQRRRQPAAPVDLGNREPQPAVARLGQPAAAGPRQR